MNTFLNDFEEKVLETLDEVHDFVNSRESTDEWSHPFINELAAVGIPLNSPILSSVLTSSIPNLKATQAQIEEAMNPEMGEMSLLLSCVDSKGDLGTFPMRFTAISPLLERAGLGGRSIRNVESKEAYNALSPEVKADMISTCLKLYKDKCKILFRDGKVATVRSSKYEVLSTAELISELENAFDANWASYRMLSAVVNHEYIRVNYILDDLIAEKTVSDLFIGTALEGYNAKVGMQFTTSDVGNSTANVSPFILLMNNDGDVVSKLPFGNEKGMKHSTGASMEKWTNTIIPQLVPLISEMTDIVEGLVHKQIKYPGGCLRHLCYTLRLPKQTALKVADSFDSMYTSCTALDVFSFLNEVVFEHERSLNQSNKVIAPSSKLKYADIVASAIFLDFKEHDYDFEWE